MSEKVLLNATEINIILHRLACQLIEKHDDFSNTALIGIQPRGKFLAKRLKHILQEDYKIKNILLGNLDITFYRDDFRRGEKILEANVWKTNLVAVSLKMGPFLKESDSDIISIHDQVMTCHFEN